MYFYKTVYNINYELYDFRDYHFPLPQTADLLHDVSEA